MATNVVVQIKYNSGADPQVTLTPAIGPITGPGCATWQIDAPGFDVAIVFDNGGPFPPLGAAPAGTYVSTGAPIVTQPARIGTNGEWKYTVSMATTNKGNPTPANGSIVVGRNP